MGTRIGAHMMLSLDGFGTGLNQTRERPFGSVDPRQLGRWMFEDAENNKAEIEAICDYGAFIMGRNMFAAPGPDVWEGDWKGWWGANPPYRAPVFVLTHYARPPIEMEGGTTFHFVTEGPDAALVLARAAAGNRNISIAGGVSTTRHYLNAGAIEDLYLHIAPMIVGAGERLWDGLTAKLEPVSARHTRWATHMQYRVET